MRFTWNVPVIVGGIVGGRYAHDGEQAAIAATRCNGIESQLCTA